MTHWITERTSYLTPYFHSWSMLQFILKKTARGMMNHIEADHIITHYFAENSTVLPIATTIESKFFTMPTRPWNTLPTLIPSVSLWLHLPELTLLYCHNGSLLFLEHIRHASASGPLCCRSCNSGCSSPDMSMVHSLTSLFMIPYAKMQRPQYSLSPLTALFFFYINHQLTYHVFVYILFFS